MSDTVNATKVSEVSYEAARDELVGIIRQMESGNLPLEQSLALWERGNTLANHCQEFLDSAKQKLEKVLPQTEV